MRCPFSAEMVANELLGSFSQMGIMKMFEDIENKLIITRRGKGWEGMNWEFEICRY